MHSTGQEDEAAWQDYFRRMNKKKIRMVPLFIMAALAAVPIVLWFFKRSPKRTLYGDDQDSTQGAATAPSVREPGSLSVEISPVSQSDIKGSIANTGVSASQTDVIGAEGDPSSESKICTARISTLPTVDLRKDEVVPHPEFLSGSRNEDVSRTENSLYGAVIEPVEEVGKEEIDLPSAADSGNDVGSPSEPIEKEQDFSPSRSFDNTTDTSQISLPILEASAQSSLGLEAEENSLTAALNVDDELDDGITTGIDESRETLECDPETNPEPSFDPALNESHVSAPSPEKVTPAPLVEAEENSLTAALKVDDELDDGIATGIDESRESLECDPEPNPEPSFDPALNESHVSAPSPEKVTPTRHVEAEESSLTAALKVDDELDDGIATGIDESRETLECDPEPNLEPSFDPALNESHASAPSPEKVIPVRFIEAEENMPTADLDNADETREDAATSAGEVEVLPEIDDEQQPVEAGNDNDGVPRRYRPPTQRMPRRQPTTVGSPRSVSKTSSDMPYEVNVRLRFDRFEYCTMSLLPERKPDLDGEIEVGCLGQTLRLVAQEEWYEDLQFDDMGTLLRKGLELRGTLADARSVRWLLTGRDLFVFASHPRISGHVSSPRLALKRTHIVLCTDDLLTAVEDTLAAAGCIDYVTFGSGLGLPQGWTGLKGVVPLKPVSLAASIDPFYAIKPAPDVEIELDGGICLRNSVWLAGFPPRIRLFGDTSSVGRLLIDGHAAEPAQDGTYAVEGSDRPGEHEIICEGLSRSRTYSIEESPAAWDAWPAYRTDTATVCGPLVQPSEVGRRIFSVPMSNPILLGSEPGQIYRCAQRPGSIWTGYVPFDVVWALPLQPIICNKKTSCILQFADKPLSTAPVGKASILRWCSAILDASRKGLQIQGGSPEGRALWNQYKKASKNYWRAAK